MDLTPFYYHKVNDYGMSIMNELRKRYIELAHYIDMHCPDSLSKSLALTELEYSQMRAIQSLAIKYGEKVDPFDV